MEIRFFFEVGPVDEQVNVDRVDTMAEHFRLWNEVVGRGSTEAVDWNATSAGT